MQEAVIRTYCESLTPLLATHLLSPLTQLIVQYLYATIPLTALHQRRITSLTAHVAKLVQAGTERKSTS